MMKDNVRARKHHEKSVKSKNMLPSKGYIHIRDKNGIYVLNIFGNWEASLFLKSLEAILP